MGIYYAKCKSSVRLDGKTAIITGCNSGIGKETVKDFYRRGAKVLMACRNLERAYSAVDEIQKECTDCENLAQLTVVHLDLSNLKSVRCCAKFILHTESKIDILINNAGIMMCPEGRTEDGFEMQFGTNHLGHFLFTLLLLPRICESQPARIINVSSKLYHFGKIDFNDINWEKKKYSAFFAYTQSKLANFLTSYELSRRLKENNISGVNVYCVHPGVIKSNLARHIDITYSPILRYIFNLLFYRFLRENVEGAQTQIYCAIAEECSQETGQYYENCQIKKHRVNENISEKLWNESIKLLHFKEDPLPRRKE